MTILFAWQLTVNYYLLKSERSKVSSTAQALADNPGSEIRWGTVRFPDELTRYCGEPELDGNGKYWTSRCGRYRFFYGKNSLQVQVPILDAERV